MKKLTLVSVYRVDVEKWRICFHDTMKDEINVWFNLNRFMNIYSSFEIVAATPMTRTIRLRFRVNADANSFLHYYQCGGLYLSFKQECQRHKI